MTFDLGGIERSCQCHCVFIGLCIIDDVLLDSGAVRPWGLLLFGTTIKLFTILIRRTLLNWSYTIKIVVHYYDNILDLFELFFFFSCRMIFIYRMYLLNKLYTYI